MLYSLFFILYSLFFILYSLFFILYSLFFILYSVSVAFLFLLFLSCFSLGLLWGLCLNGFCVLDF
ncbi:hypothetical protein FIM74_06840 [Helicobacter pylori]|nr:hypothetical protein FIM74_06840 [Helicobacter pylori]